MPIAKQNEVDETRLLLKAEAVARKLSVGRATAYELMASGILPTVRIGRSVRVPARALEQWVEREANAK
jgi:excisionase family DNA binding protein